MSFRLVSDATHDSVKVLTQCQLPIENNISSGTRTPVEGCLVYDVATKGVFVGNGAEWVSLGGASNPSATPTVPLPPQAHPLRIAKPQ